MLEEAIEVIRTLWRGRRATAIVAATTAWSTRASTTCRSRAPPIFVSGFGPKSIELAARIGDGYCTVGPDADSVELFRDQRRRRQARPGRAEGLLGRGRGDARATCIALWPNEALPGELAQILPTPAHFEQATELVTEDSSPRSALWPGHRAHLEAIKAFRDAGFDELYVNQIGPDQDEFFPAYRDHVLPRLRGEVAVSSLRWA